MAEKLERAAQDVRVQEGTEIPDVRVVVDGGAAGVEPEGPAMTLRKKLSGLPREGVV
jgi:hypothetical protein